LDKVDLAGIVINGKKILRLTLLQARPAKPRNLATGPLEYSLLKFCLILILPFRLALTLLKKETV